LHFNPNKDRPAQRPGEGYIMATTTTIVPSSLATLTPAAHPTRTQVIEALTLAATREGSGGFASAMLGRVSNGQDLTQRMRDCVIDLTQREARRLNAATAAASAARLDASGICKMFDSARAHGAQRIAITLATAGGIRFGLARNGVIYISDAAEFGNRRDYGRIAVGGSEIILRDEVDSAVALAIAAVAADPAAAIVRHGHLTGKCSFCCRPLTDGGSIAHGYGEICASKYGLPWNSESNRELRKQVAAAAAAPQPPHGE
jgi:hypothetical protein